MQVMALDPKIKGICATMFGYFGGPGICLDPEGMSNNGLLGLASEEQGSTSQTYWKAQGGYNQAIAVDT